MTTGDRILARLPATSRQLLKAMPMSTSALHKWLTRLRAAGQLHIGRWRRSVGDLVAVWTAGPGPDAVRPRRRSPAELTAAYRRRKKKEADELGARRQAAAEIAALARFDRDPLMAALFGR